MQRKVYLNGRFLTQPLTGVQRVALELTRHLDRQLERDPELRRKLDIILIHPPGIKYRPALKCITMKQVGFFTGNLWEQAVLPVCTFGHLLVSMCMISCIAKRKQIVFVHDASCFVNPGFFTFAFRIWYKTAITLLGKVALRIVTVSEHAKGELVKYAGISRGKIRVIHPSAKHFTEVQPSAAEEEAFIAKHSLNHPYILAVSGLSPNKNFAHIMEAYKLLSKESFPDLRLVIAGGANPKVFQGRMSFDSTVKYLGYVSDKELACLYRHARVFAYPSYYEGFGIPPLEAMLFGCLVIVGNTSSMPEVCGDAAFYCDPHSVHDIATKMHAALSLDKAEKEEIVKRGYRRSEGFDWNQCAEKTLEEIQSLR